ncbi:MAG TPA: DUF805 domain-containing protein [Candidatus Cybelea sp.]|jgi:uncharacterized membrane protein YhaH (DUF805 family)|nr:DUF805 domain-containing protein [Candidatus Cybelea sp.]
MNYFVEALGKYAVFSGRARRSEYWFFTLFSTLIGLFLVAIGLYIGKATGGPPTLARYLIDFYGLLIFLPTIAVSVRRLHDVGMSGWWVLLNVVPLGSLVLFVIFCQDSQPGDNRFGANPKELAAPAF